MTGSTRDEIEAQIRLLEETNAWVQGQARRSYAERRWNQDVWRDVAENPDTHRCSTSFCFAGKVIELGGSEWKWSARQITDSRQGRIDNPAPYNEEDTVKADDARGWPEESAGRRAERLIGLESGRGVFGLFSGGNSARVIDLFVSQIIAKKRSTLS